MFFSKTVKSLKNTLVSHRFTFFSEEFFSLHTKPFSFGKTCFGNFTE
eukprot:UN17417